MNIKNLKELLDKEIGLEVMAMVNTEIVADDSHTSWMAQIGKSRVDLYCVDDGVWFWSKLGPLKEKVYDDIVTEGKITSSEKVLEKVGDIIQNLKWERVIVVEIDSPDGRWI